MLFPQIRRGFLFQMQGGDSHYYLPNTTFPKREIAREEEKQRGRRKVHTTTWHSRIFRRGKLLYFFRSSLLRCCCCCCCCCFENWPSLSLFPFAVCKKERKGNVAGCARLLFCIFSHALKKLSGTFLWKNKETEHSAHAKRGSLKKSRYSPFQTR